MTKTNKSNNTLTTLSLAELLMVSGGSSITETIVVKSEDDQSPNADNNEPGTGDRDIG